MAQKREREEMRKKIRKYVKQDLDVKDLYVEDYDEKTSRYVIDREANERVNRAIDLTFAQTEREIAKDIKKDMLQGMEASGCGNLLMTKETINEYFKTKWGIK